MSEDLLDQLAEYGRKRRRAQRTIPLAEIITEGAVHPIPGAVELDAGINDREIAMVTAHANSNTRINMTRRWLVGGVAAAVVVAFVAGVALLRSDEDEAADHIASVSTSTDLTRAESPPPTTTDLATTTIDPAATTIGTSAIDSDSTSVAVVPADALRAPNDGEVGATSETPLPDFDAAELADRAEPPGVLSSVDDLPDSARLDFLAEFCDDRSCFRDAYFRDRNGSNLSGGWGAGEPFHIRHGFVTDGPGELGDGFDLAVYVFPMPPGGGIREASGPTQRFTTDAIVRGETDACGPGYQSQTGTVTCEWFVHDFPNGLPEGRWALWAVWEAPCGAWFDLGLTDECTDPDQVMSFFSSGVDSPFGEGASGVGGEPIVADVGEWTRVDGLDVFGVVSDGTRFFAYDGNAVIRSDDGVSWENHSEPDDSLFQFDSYGYQPEHGSSAALRDGRLVAVEDLRGVSVIVHHVDTDGTLSTRVVPVEVPAPYEPFHRELNPGVHLLDDGRIVITASYSADASLVAATGQTRAELGLDLFYPAPRPIIIVSDDGETWTQLDLPAVGIDAIATIPGGLVARVGPVLAGPFQTSVSTDGVTWEPVIDLETGQPLSGPGPGILTTGNRAFLTRSPGFGDAPDEDRMWEVTIDGARLIAGGDASSEPLELFQRFHHGRLTAGGAGIAFVSAVDEEFVDPLPDGEGIRYSSDDGNTWEFEPFPDDLRSPGQLSVGASAMVLTAYNRDGSTTLWIRDFPT